MVLRMVWRVRGVRRVCKRICRGTRVITVNAISNTIDPINQLITQPILIITHMISQPISQSNNSISQSINTTNISITIINISINTTNISINTTTTPHTPQLLS